MRRPRILHRAAQIPIRTRADRLGTVTGTVVAMADDEDSGDPDEYQDPDNAPPPGPVSRA